MVEVRCEFKLFGKNISVSDDGKGGWKHEMKDHISTNETTISQDSEHEMKSTTNFVTSEEHKTGDQEIENREVLKKPDKILACPRCSSMDTKFCYFNNYNINQPRYFCKNCQRYWTSGGTMRNVPVGSGRRKTKHVLNHYRAITVSHFNPNVTLLAFNGSTLVNHYYPSPSSSGSRSNSSLGKHSRDWEILTQDVEFGKKWNS